MEINVFFNDHFEPLLLAEVDSTSSSPDFEQWFHAQLLNTDQSYTIV